MGSIVSVVRQVGRQFRSNPLKGLGGVPLAAVTVAKQKKAKGQAEDVRISSLKAGQIQRESAKRAIAEESTKAQKDKARKRTIFAGSDIEREIFRRTLGGGAGSTTLGV